MPTTEEKIQIINDWMEETGSTVIDMNAAARWAIKSGRWEPPPFDPLKACAKELSRAAREEFYTDPQGREVRKKHCYTVVDPNGQRRWLWIDIVTAQPDKMHMSLQSRRRSALGDVVQLKRDQDSYNDNNQFGAQIQMSFNFDEDLAEMEHPTEFDDNPENAD